jgi:hypothetical protein
MYVAMIGDAVLAEQRGLADSDSAGCVIDPGANVWAPKLALRGERLARRSAPPSSCGFRAVTTDRTTLTAFSGTLPHRAHFPAAAHLRAAGLTALCQCCTARTGDAGGGPARDSYRTAKVTVGPVAALEGQWIVRAGQQAALFRGYAP